MQKTKNILDIYDTLYKASDNLFDETDDYVAGFKDAVYMLCIGLKSYEHINLHIVNRKLSRELFLAKLAIDDRYEDRGVLQKKIESLQAKLKQQQDLKPKTFTFRGQKHELNKVQIEYEDNLLYFYTNATNDQFQELFDEAQIEATKKRVKHASDIKARVMNFYRTKGFRCEAK